jgi:hypothetical protein
VSAEKYGLIIAIGDYPTKTGWSTISSENDVSLIKQALLNHGFNEKNISLLVNDEATKAGIIKAIEDLKAKIKAMQTLGVPYPEGFAEMAEASLKKQSIEIQANLKKDGIETSSEKEVIAMIAYLQRLGKDIKTVSVNNTK